MLNAFINYLDHGIKSFLNSFADDTKLGRIMNKLQDGSAIQKGLDRWKSLAEDNRMKFSVDKCKVLKLRKNN